MRKLAIFGIAFILMAVAAAQEYADPRTHDAILAEAKKLQTDAGTTVQALRERFVRDEKLLTGPEVEELAGEIESSDDVNQVIDDATPKEEGKKLWERKGAKPIAGFGMIGIIVFVVVLVMMRRRGGRNRGEGDSREEPPGGGPPEGEDPQEVFDRDLKDKELKEKTAGIRKNMGEVRIKIKACKQAMDELAKQCDSAFKRDSSRLKEFAKRVGRDLKDMRKAVENKRVKIEDYVKGISGSRKDLNDEDKQLLIAFLEESRIHPNAGDDDILKELIKKREKTDFDNRKHNLIELKSRMGVLEKQLEEWRRIWKEVLEEARKAKEAASGAK